MFPVFDAAQIETARRFASGPARRFAPGEIVYEVGMRYVPAWLVLAGSIDVVRGDGLGSVASFTTHRAGQLSGEISQLGGRGTLAAGRAGPDGATALPFDAAHVRALVVGSAEIGEIVMRAFILRRVALLEADGAGSVLIGRRAKPIWCGCRASSLATAIPARCWTPPPMPKATPWSSGSACCPTSCP